jgi:RNA polymerase sigma factor (TIGR02999 family)
MSDVTHLVGQFGGDPRRSEELLPLVYDELRKLAAHKLAQEKSGQTLTATALVHEAYLRLAGGEHTRQWNDRWHFFAVAAEAMRRILVDNARRKQSLKRGGDRQRHDWDAFEATWEGPGDDLLALDEALKKLEAQVPRKAELVKLRFFGGLSMDQAAEALDISRSTAQNDWAYARCWLRVEIAGKEGSS